MKKNLHQYLVNAAVLCARMVVLFSMIASQFFGAAPQPVFAVVYVDVGIVLPYDDGGRWHQDKARLEADLTAAGITSQVLFSNGNSVQEAANVNSLLAKNIKVLIICPVDGDAAAITVAAARAAKPSLKIIAYDRLITGTPALNFYVTFDSIAVGEAMGQYLVDHAGAGSGKPLYLYAGNAGDNNAFLFFQGSWSVLQPKIADGTFVIQNSSEAIALKDQLTLSHAQQAAIIAQIDTQWDANTAGNLATTNLATGAKGDVFILSPYDGVTRAIADVFAADGGVSSYVITGQDAEWDSVQYIIDGKQSMTVFKDTRTLADKTVIAAHSFLHNQTPASNSTYNNGNINVPAWSTATVTVDQTNFKAALIDSGYYGCNFVSHIPLCQFIQASVQNNWIQARKWPKGTEVKLEIDDLSNGLGGVDYTTTATMGDAPWNPTDPNESLAEFNMGSFTLAVGDVVSVSENIVTPPVTKALTVSAFHVTSFNVAADTVSGTANTGANVDVCVNIPDNCILRSITATAGTWTVDFTVDHDLQQGDNGWAVEYDADSDQTFYGWNVPNPHIQVRTNDDTIVALDWPMGTLLSLSINNPATGVNPDYSASETVTETTPWGSGETYALFETGAFDIQPGFIVSVSGGGTTRNYTVTGLEITGFDLAANIVSGIAAPNSDVEIWACWDNGCTNNHQATADGSGNWSTDFTADYDIVDGTWVDSAQWGENGNGTMFGQSAFEPNHDIISSPDFSADFTADKLHGYGWPLGASVSLTIDGTSVAGVGPQVVGGTIGHTTLLFDLGAFDLQPGQEVSMTDGTHIETHTLTNLSELSVGFIQTGPENDYGWRNINTASFVDTAEQNGLPLKRYFGQNQQANQLWAFNQFIQDPDVNVIVLTAVTMNGWGTILQTAQAAGKVVILQDRAVNAPDTLYATHVTNDLVAEGRKAGTEMCNLLAGSPGKNVVELVGSPSQAATDRATGFREIVKSCGITITQSQTANFNYDDGKQVMTDFLQASTNIQGVFAHNDEMGLGAIQAIKDHGGLTPGSGIKIVSVDGIADALTALDAGELNASIECTPRMAPLVYNAALQKLNGQTIPKTIFVQETVYRETVHPSVKSIVVASANPTSASSVDFTVTFSRAVTGVDKADFKLTTTTLTGAFVTNVTGSDDTYTVTVNTGTGNGTIRLDVLGTASIQDLAAHAINNPYTSGETYTVNKGTAPTVPVLKSPANGALVSGALTLDWGDSSQVMALTALGWHYEINISSPFGYNETFNTADNTDPLVGLGESQYLLDTATLPESTTFTWKVRAYNDQNQYSTWSASRTFLTKAASVALLAPTLTWPVDDPPLDNRRPTFEWSAVNGATSYTLQILKENSTTHLFTVVAVTGTITAPLHTYTPIVDLLPDTTYKWQVKANGAIPSAYSAQSSFKTSGNPPKVPVLTLPASAALVDSTVEQTLKWSPVPGVTTTSPATTYPVAKSFQVEYAANSAFTGSTIKTVNDVDPSDKLPLSQTIDGLLPNLTYYWRVRSWSDLDATGFHSIWSAARTFRTKLATPVLNLPVKWALLDNKRPTFTWTEVPGATSYTLQILKGTAVVNTGTITAPAYTYTSTVDLILGTVYTWKVKANGANAGDYSAPFTFTTSSANPPKVPVLSAPANGVLVDSTVPQTLDWNQVLGVSTASAATTYLAAASFEVEYAMNSSFTGVSDTLVVVNDNTVAGTHTDPIPLLPGRTYSWRVRSWSEADATGIHSAWSVVRTIKVKFVAPTLGATPTGSGDLAFAWASNNGLWTNYTLTIINSTTNKVVKSFTVPAPTMTYTVPAASLPTGTYRWQVKINGLYTPISSAISVDTIIK